MISIYRFMAHLGTVLCFGIPISKIGFLSLRDFIQGWKTDVKWLIVILILTCIIVAVAFIIWRFTKNKKATLEHSSQDQQVPIRQTSQDSLESQPQQNRNSDHAPMTSDFGLELILNDNQTFRLSLPATIGRSQENTIFLPYDSVSATHAKIYLDERTGVVCIEDLDSLNGIFINGRPTLRNVLDDGAKITIGDVTLIFRNTGFLPLMIP